MSSTPTSSFSLPLELGRRSQESVRFSKCSSANEVVRAGLRLQIERDQAQSQGQRPAATLEAGR